MSDFYVGYLPKAPAPLGRRTRITIVVLFILAAAGAALFANSQRTVSTPATFEFGQEGTFEGTLVTLPYPALLVARPAPQVDQPQFSYYSLVAQESMVPIPTWPTLLASQSVSGARSSIVTIRPWSSLYPVL